jgi:hypothetical protein
MADVLTGVFGAFTDILRTGFRALAYIFGASRRGMASSFRPFFGGMAGIFGRGLGSVSCVLGTSSGGMAYIFTGVLSIVAGILHVLLGRVLRDRYSDRNCSGKQDKSEFLHSYTSEKLLYK